MSTKKPHILFINTDQLRADFIGCYGFSLPTTPNIDRLASEGTLFRNTFTQCPLCAPARYALTSGHYVRNHGALGNNHETYPSVRSLLDDFNRNGYHTVAIGKLHHNPPDLKFGFREVFLHDGTFRSRRPFSVYSQWLAEQEIDEDELASAVPDDDPEKKRLAKVLIWGRCRLAERFCESTFLADFAARYSADYTLDRPLLMYLSFVAPHSPYCPPAPYNTLFSPDDIPLPPVENADQLARKHRSLGLWSKKRYGAKGIPPETMKSVRAQYAGLLRHLDEAVGKAVGAFRKRFGENVAVVLTSDHGDFLGEHLKCEKHLMYDTATRVPHIVCWPGRIPAGLSTDVLTEQIDMLPTLLGMVGAEWNPGAVSGKDRSAEILGGAPTGARFVFSENHTGLGPHAAYTAMVRSANRKLIVCLDDDPAHAPFFEFYDLEKDPFEVENVVSAPAYAPAVSEHKAALWEWMLRSEARRPPAGFTYNR